MKDVTSPARGAGPAETGAREDGRGPRARLSRRLPRLFRRLRRRRVAGAGLVASLLLLAVALRPVDEPRRRVVPAPVTDVSGLAWDGERLWVTAEGTGRAVRVDPDTGAVEGAVGLPVRETGGSAWVDGELYQLGWSARRIYRIDPASGRVLGSFPSPGRGMSSGMTYDGRHLWVANWEDPALYRVDPRRGGRTVASRPGGFEVTGLAWDGRHLWNGLLVGPSEDHAAPPPLTGFVQAVDLANGRTVRALPVSGVFAGTTDWVPGRGPARRMWWFDGRHQELVEFSWRPPAGLVALRAVAALLVAFHLVALAAGRVPARARSRR